MNAGPMKRYTVREMFYSLQGEGIRSGTANVFVRFSGCNLWDGVEANRARGRGACAAWCDTDFAHGDPMLGTEIIERMASLWPTGWERACVVTGGEPALQMDTGLIRAMRGDGWFVAVETNGTIDSEAVRLCDHRTYSPKRGSAFIPHQPSEIKVVIPGGADGGWSGPELDDMAGKYNHCHLFLQPEDGPNRMAHEDACVAIATRDPRWRVGVQMHKLLRLR